MSTFSPAASSSAVPTATALVVSATPAKSTPGSEAATDAPPPRGYLASGPSSVEGWIGSYCWQDACADSPSLPPKATLPEIRASDGQLAFSLSDGSTFVRWTISYGDASDTPLEVLDQGGEAFDPDALPQPGDAELTSVQFVSPPAGDWLLVAFVQFPGGDLSYAWHVLVP